MDSKINKLRKIILGVIKSKELTPTDILKEKGLTSINVMLILGQIENIFDIELPVEELNADNFQSIMTISEMISRVKEKR